MVKSASCARVIQILRPLITQSSPSRTARVRIPAGSAPAPGSEIPIAETEKIDSVNYLRVPVSFSKGERWFSINGQILSNGTLLIDSLVTSGQFTYSVGDTLRNGFINRLFKKSDQVVRLHIDNPNIQLQGMSNIYIKDRKKWFETTGFKIGFGALLGFGLASAK